MKRKIHSRFFDDIELEVADILLHIPHIIFESKFRLPFAWGVRRKRSAIDPGLSLAPTNVSSPATPLSFSPSESDEKCKRIRVSYKKKEDWLTMVGGLTHQRELLKSEFEKVEGLYNTMKAFNSELKARKQQLNLETAIAEPRVESGEQVHLQQPLPLLLRHSAQTSALVPSTAGSDVVYPIGPCVIPDLNDLNVSPKETLGPDLSQPLDFNLNIALNFDTTQLKRAEAAQARKKRLRIYRVKKPKGGSTPSILSFG